MFIKDELRTCDTANPAICQFSNVEGVCRQSSSGSFQCEGSLPTEFLWFRSVKLNYISAVASSLTLSRPHSEY